MKSFQKSEPQRDVFENSSYNLKNLNSPVGQIKKREHQRKGNPRDDVDPLRPRRELGHPQAAAVLASWFKVDLALPHLGVAAAHQRLLQLQTSQGGRTRLIRG